MAILLVRTALTYFGESKFLQRCRYFARPEHRQPSHRLNADFLRPDEFRFQLRFAVFQEHGHDLAQIRLQLILRRPLRMGAREPGDVANEEVRLRVSLDDCREGSHAISLPVCIQPVNDIEPQQRRYREGYRARDAAMPAAATS